MNLGQFAIPDKEGVDSPVFLENTVGSLSQERRNQMKKSYKLYNLNVFKSRKLVSKLTVHSIIDPTFGIEKVLETLSHQMASYPTVSYDLTINVQDLTKSNTRLLRSFLFYFYTNYEKFGYFRFYIEESLDKLINEKSIARGKIFIENYIIRQTFITLGSSEGLKLLENIYSSSNIRHWIKTGESLSSSYCFIKIPLAKVKDKVYRRGYKETSVKNYHKPSTLNERRLIDMGEENKEIERLRNEIKLKQLQLFSERLDRYLEIGNSNLNILEKREIFNSLIFGEQEIDQKSSIENTEP